MKADTELSAVIFPLSTILNSKQIGRTNMATAARNLVE
jgi:hypothetical protein